MVFSHLSFVCLFLPAVLAYYFVAPRSARKVVLVLGLSPHFAGAAIAGSIRPLHHRFSAVSSPGRSLLIANPIGAVADQLFSTSPADLPICALRGAVLRAADLWAPRKIAAFPDLRESDA
jgi:hypothetical protein